MAQVKLKPLVQERPNSFKDKLSMFRCEECERAYLNALSKPKPTELPYFFYSYKKKSRNECPICGMLGLTRFSIGAVMNRRWNGRVKPFLLKVNGQNITVKNILEQKVERRIIDVHV